MRSPIQTIKQHLSLKISLVLAAILLGLTALAGSYITLHQREMMEKMTLEKARLAAELGARMYGEMFEAAIDSETLTVSDVFDRNYSLIKGYDWGKHPKFHTRYDFVTDRSAIVFQDKILKNPDFVYAVGADENGYVPTHNSRYQKVITGKPEEDLVGNRSKRIFNNPVELAAAKNIEPFILQVYKRDTGVTMWDVGVPIFVKGKHWGGFRLGVSMEHIARNQQALTWVLLIAFGVFGLVATGAIFLMLRRTMRPVVALTHAADQISMGEALEEAIKSKSTDEIGQLTRSIDRLRSSMKAAMARLGE